MVLMPPEAQWEQIQAIRAVHDKAYTRWMPHINLLYPFVPERYFSQWLPKLTKALASFQPFQLTFKEFDSFSHGKANKTLFLKPDPESRAILQKIQSKLEEAVPICNDLSQISGNGFQPHLTLGQWQSAPTLQAAVASFAKTWRPITFLVSELYLIARSGQAPFEIKHRVPFGSVAPAAPAPAPASPSPSPSPSPSAPRTSFAPRRPAPSALSVTEPVEPIMEKSGEEEEEEEKNEERNEEKEQEEKEEGKTGGLPPILPIEPGSEKAALMKKVRAWHEANRARGMLPKNKYKLQNALAGICNLVEEVDCQAVFDRLAADQYITVKGEKVTYMKRKDGGAAAAGGASAANSDEPGPKKPTIELVVEKAKKWVTDSRDPPASVAGLKACLQQLCRYKRVYSSAELVEWMIQRRMLIVDDKTDAVTYNLGE